LSTELHPRDYDYSGPTRKCDIVMKGGITSGVVYPHAVCELARTYRFQNIGGTSAGAIAAAAAAAAELGRGAGGFRRLAGLPDWLGSGTNLFSLFQPQRRTRGLFRTLTAGFGKRRRPLRMLLAAIRYFPLYALAGVLPGAALVVAFALLASGLALVLGLACAILLLALGLTLGLAYGLYRSATRGIPANLYGLCSGLGEGSTPAITSWLAQELDHLAGKAQTDGTQPLTFGDLWRGPPGHRSAEGERYVDLAMMTTNLTLRRPHRLPWNERVFFFDPAEFRRLFPEPIVEWMENHPPPPTDASDPADWELLCRLMEPLRPFPAAADLPVVVAARMSLSFPILISAVPLWAVDMRRGSNDEARKAWRGWLKENAADWERLRDDREAWRSADKPAQVLRADVCWFSDGGLSSNLPIHFFDAPIPRWPTFAINLAPFPPGRSRAPDEADNTSLPDSNLGGLLETWASWSDKSGWSALLGFANAIVRTMQNWVDNAQTRVPGYRDRIVHIWHTEDEGGLNLSMPEHVIGALTARGGRAGGKLVERFAGPGDTAAPGWDNHRWIRYRSTMAVLEEMLGTIARGYGMPREGQARAYRELVTRGAGEAPPSYRWRNRAQGDLALMATDRLIEVFEQLDAAESSFGDGAPNPHPEARIVPRL
jgi:predicted acylesterase/phospholipase RssA